MKICLSCGCEIVKMHRTDANCLKALSIEIPRLQRRLQDLEAAQHRLAADNLPAGHSGSSLTCPHPFCVAEREAAKA